MKYRYYPRLIILFWTRLAVGVIGAGSNRAAAPGIYPFSALFVGDGYNLLKGNPDGNFGSSGGDDPGFMLSRKILSINSTNPSEEIQYEQHGTCHESHSFHLVHGPKSYQDKLMQNIRTSGSAKGSLDGAAFTLSSGFKSVATQTSQRHYVLQDKESYCRMGLARYKMSLVETKGLMLTDEFVRETCQLPEQYNETAYMGFLDRWGTHIITEVDVGKTSTQRYLAKLKDYFKYVLANSSNDVNNGGHYLGHDTSYVVDLASFSSSSEYANPIGTLQDTLNTGTDSNPEPIGLGLQSIDVALGDKFWTNNEYYPNLCNQNAENRLYKWRANLIRALGRYAVYNGAVQPTEQPLSMPVVWPEGTYGLPKPTTGCPGDHSTWQQGTLFQHTETQHPDNSWTNGIHLDATLNKTAYLLRFCVKIASETQFGLPWPRGDYCMFKSGACPTGFQDGYIKWDDENTNNANKHSGILPDGTYNTGDTLMRYCCRSDGYYTVPITMPTDRPFYLFRSKNACQQVTGMTVRTEKIVFDFEDEYGTTHADISPVHPGSLFCNPPKHPGCGTGVTIYYCYYEKQSVPSIIG